MSLRKPSTSECPLPDGAQRLMRSRLAILDYLRQADEGPRSSRWSSLRDAARRRWEGHPARLAAGLAAPLLSHWGRRHPLALIAIAIAGGALLVLARPWRLVSLTGLLMAALKSPHLASAAISALATSQARPQPHDRDPRPR